MNLLEAIQGAGESWIRPMAWFNSGIAYEITDGMLLLRDGQCDELVIVNSVRHLTGEWEIVTPEQVLAERKL